jgi:beta-galactosidase
MIRESFDRGWFVALEDDPGPATAVTLPHDAMIAEERDPTTPFDQTNGYHPGGVYRYTKTFDAPPSWQGAAAIVEFEGVYRNSEVRLNGRVVGGRPYGYSIFEVRLDGALRFDAPNELEVIVRNDQLSARWYTGSGIYRPVNLLVGGPIRIDTNGLRLRTTSLDGDVATIEAAVDLVNDTDAPRTVTVAARLTRPSGEDLAPTEITATIAARATTTLRQTAAIPAADLWSCATPALHLATVTLTAEDGEALDEARDHFGIRTITVDAERGLRINGETVKLRGGCVHHDNGVIGAHTLEVAEDRSAS